MQAQNFMLSKINVYTQRSIYVSEKGESSAFLFSLFPHLVIFL